MSYDSRRDNERSLPNVFQRLGKSHSNSYSHQPSKKTWTNSQNNSFRPPIDKRLNFNRNYQRNDNEEHKYQKNHFKSNGYQRNDYSRNNTFPDYNKIMEIQKISPSITYYPQGQNDTHSIPPSSSSSSSSSHQHHHSPVPQDDFSFVRNQPSPMPEDHQPYISFVKDTPAMSYPYDSHMNHPMITSNPNSAPHTSNSHYSAADSPSFKYVSSPMSDRSNDDDVEYHEEPNPSRDRLAKNIKIFSRCKTEADRTRQVIVTPSDDTRRRSRSPSYRRKRTYSDVSDNENDDDDTSSQEYKSWKNKRHSRSPKRSVSPDATDDSSTDMERTKPYLHKRSNRSDSSRSTSPSYRRHPVSYASSDEEHAPFLELKPDFYTPDYKKRPLPAQFREKKKHASKERPKELRNYPPLGSSFSSMSSRHSITETKTPTNKTAPAKSSVPPSNKSPALKTTVTTTKNTETNGKANPAVKIPATSTKTTLPKTPAKTSTNNASTAKKVPAVTVNHKAAGVNGAAKSSEKITSATKTSSPAKATSSTVKSAIDAKTNAKTATSTETAKKAVKSSAATTPASVKIPEQKKVPAKASTSVESPNKKATNTTNDTSKKSTSTIQSQQIDPPQEFKVEPSLQQEAEASLLSNHAPSSSASSLTGDSAGNTASTMQPSTSEQNRPIKKEPVMSPDKNNAPAPQDHELDIDDRDDVVVDVMPPTNRKSVTPPTQANTTTQDGTPSQVDQHPIVSQTETQSTVNASLPTLQNMQEVLMNEQPINPPVIPQLSLLIQHLQQQPQISSDIANQLLALNNALGQHEATKKQELHDSTLPPIPVMPQQQTHDSLSSNTAVPDSMQATSSSVKRSFDNSPEDEATTSAKKLKKDWKDDWKVQFREDGELQYVNTKTGEIRLSRPW